MNFTPVLNVILRRRNARSSSLEANSSSSGTSRGSASTTVTSAPKLVNTLAQLDADHAAAEHDDPLPGTSSSRMASLLVMIRPPISRPGSDRA